MSIAQKTFPSVLFLLAAAVAMTASSPCGAAEPTIPVPFHGTWSMTAGSCEPSVSMLIDEHEVMFGETGFFVDRIERVTDTETIIVASQPPESATQAIVTLHLRVAADGKTLTVIETDEPSVTRHRCASSTGAAR